MRVSDLATPALVIDADALAFNLTAMAQARPGTLLRPHVKAHKCTSLARAQAAHGHSGFTCATPREVVAMAAAGLGDDLLLANEVLDPRRLDALAAAQDDAMVTVAVDSEETIEAAARAGVRHVLVDVAVGLPRCGCRPQDAGRLADRARAAGLTVRGVMGYEGHLMVVEPAEQADKVAAAMALLRAAHADVGGDIVSAGGTGTYHLHDTHLHDTSGVTEVQAGSYALMDTSYAAHAARVRDASPGTGIQPFRLAASVLGTVVSVSAGHAVADVGLKALGMDHGNPAIDGAAVWFCSDEHVTFAAQPGTATPRVGERIQVWPAHIDPTMAMHDTAWLVRGDEVLERWPIDMRGW